MKKALPDGMVIYAMRYALGRRSYAVGECVDYLIANWRYLEPRTREVIKRDIRKAITEGRAGMDMDVADWKRVLELPED
jgi:hypothetical protein